MLDFLFPRLLRRLRHMSAQFDRLVNEVSEMRSATDSVLAVLSDIAQQLRDSAGDEAKVNELADQLDQMQADIAAAVTANTPAQEPETP